MQLISVIAKLNFQQSLLQSSVSHDASKKKKHSSILILLFLKYLNNFVETVIFFFSEFFDELHLCQIEIFFNIINSWSV